MTDPSYRSNGSPAQSCATLPSLAILTFEPGSYVIDTRQSLVTVSIRTFFGISRLTAAFEIVRGQVTVASPTARSQACAVIRAASFSSDRPSRDRRAVSSDFLAADLHPFIRFHSTQVHQVRSLTRVKGLLEVGGQERSVELEVHLVEPHLDDAYCVQARTVIDRRAFGISKWRGILARHLEVRINVRLIPSLGIAPNATPWRGWQ